VGMIPRAKKNLHECEYHLNIMSHSRHIEELEISFTAFVNSARNVTFVLQKEFNKNPSFEAWYKKKQLEMDEDPLCKFFIETRNRITKEGINGLRCSTHIQSLNIPTDMPDKPTPNCDIVINEKGMYWLVNKGLPQEDLIPAFTRGSITTRVFIHDAPTHHLGKEIQQNDVITISQIYYDYLKNMVEEFAGIINKVSE
jgi:hypothetical protein